MKIKKILNTKLKDIIKYCNNNICSDTCPFKKICWCHNPFVDTTYQLILMMSTTVDKELNKDDK